MPELNVIKMLDEQEKLLKENKADFYASVEAGLAETVSGIKAVNAEISSELLQPLYAGYNITKDPEVKSFISRISAVISKFNHEISRAGAKFAEAFGKNVYFGKYMPSFEAMKIKLPALPANGALGFVPAVPIATYTLRQILLSGITDAIIQKVANIPFIKDALEKIAGLVLHSTYELQYIFKPDQRKRAHRISADARALEKQVAFIDAGFSAIISATRNMQGSLTKELDALTINNEASAQEQRVQSGSQAQPETPIRNAVKLPYTIIPEPTTEIITVNGDKVGYRTKYQRQWLSDEDMAGLGYMGEEYRYHLIQYLFDIYVPKEDFPFDTPNFVHREEIQARSAGI